MNELNIKQIVEQKMKEISTKLDQVKRAHFLLIVFVVVSFFIMMLVLAFKVL